ncbi:HNH endonuclease [Caballeronia arationis]|nr:HNH endonuclease signature motif containing protein [Caballeronia arationis]
MDDLKPGDVVFNYSKAGLMGYCRVLAAAVDESWPYSRPSSYKPEQGGKLVAVTYQSAPAPITRSILLANEMLKKALRTGVTPSLVERSGENLNQIYLCRLDDHTLPNLLFAALGLSAQFSDTSTPSKSKDAETTQKRLVDARLGQGDYRADLVKLWDGECALTGLSLLPLLIASHIKPWKCSSNSERLDAHNGLLLAAGVDRAFDRYLLTFESDGSIRTKLPPHELSLIGIPSLGGELPKLRALHAEREHYLRHHRRVYEAAIERSVATTIT